MTRVIITGAAGYVGLSLVKRLAACGYYVYAVVRPGSRNNNRLNDIDTVQIIECDLAEFDRLPYLIGNPCEAFFHLAWAGANRDDFERQNLNIDYNIRAVEVASRLCRQIIITGSQAEYGIRDTETTEELMPQPISAYGAAKVAACYLTRYRACQLGIEWKWARIYSLIGAYEPSGRMMPELINSLKTGRSFTLSSCEQDWDYLDVDDASEALLALSLRGRAGEIYNVANGRYRPLREYVEIARRVVSPKGVVLYGKRAEPFICLRPSVEKIKADTGWKPRKRFEESVHGYLRSLQI